MLTSGPLRIDTGACMEARIGEAGLTTGLLRDFAMACEPARRTLARAWQDGAMPLLALPARTDDLGRARAIANEWRARFDHVLVLGTGGSSLGGQTVCRLADHGFGPERGGPRLHFLDNVDPAPFEALFARLDPGRTGVIAISKSGRTAETLCQTALCLDWLAHSPAAGGPAARMLVIAEAADNPLRRLAARAGLPVLEHDPMIDGRYSGLTLNGLLPALIAGLDAARARAGAAAVLADALVADPPGGAAAPAIGAAASIALHRHRGITQTVLMPYVAALDRFTLWFRQLWAESLGKDGKGTTPLAALGAVDQHSQLQLWLAGPPDKLFTLILADHAGTGGRVAASDDGIAPDWMVGRTMGDLMAAQQRATAETLIEGGRPVRIIRIERADEYHLGALMMHFFLETILAADLLGVAPFGQPAVEQGKKRARELLAAMGDDG